VSSFIAKKEECDRLAAGAPDTQRTKLAEGAALQAITAFHVVQNFNFDK
jgi:hypothetical protein